MPPTEQHLSRTRFQFGSCACDSHTVADLLGEIRELLPCPGAQPRTITFLNAHVFNLARKDPELLRNINRSRLVVADGMSIVRFAPLFGGRLVNRCNMTEAFRAFLAAPAMPPTRALLIGGSRDVSRLAAASINAQSEHCRVVDAVSGYHDEDDYRDVLRRYAHVDLILIGMGSPTSERTACIASEICKKSLIWHIGGGTLMFLSGAVPEAPTWMRKTGLQWLHRLCVEPKRMWKRYVIGNPLFIGLVLKAWLKRNRNGTVS